MESGIVGGSAHESSEAQSSPVRVIQPTSVIQTTPALNSLSKGNIILVGKPNSVIHTTAGGGIQTLQVIDARDVHEDENTKKRREILARRPSYRKILNELGGGEISEDKGDSPLTRADSGSQSSWGDGDSPPPPTSRVSLGYQTAAGQLLKVIPASALQLTGGSSSEGLQALAMTNSTSGGTLLQYAAQGQDGQLYVPVSVAGDLQAYAFRPVTTSSGLSVLGSSSSSSVSAAEDRKRELKLMKSSHDDWDSSEPAVQKRELRLLKNREAARECRRKKKEYIKCLENRVAVLENQNKALIEELKSLKELYCNQQSD
uniref:EOG090X0DMT n=1 Tax=Lynceus sp. MCZ IZ 141354 TaxID=1930659 RepID=A0A9N6WTF4_9CRUS|nr:EOG090X0DMT [Lynceus sp. MCZ IZ 141354]